MGRINMMRQDRIEWLRKRIEELTERLGRQVELLAGRTLSPEEFTKRMSERNRMLIDLENAERDLEGELNWVKKQNP